MNPSLQFAMSMQIPYPIVGAALWDHLGEISIKVHDQVGQWAISDSEQSLRSHVTDFAKTVFDSEPDILWGDPDKMDPIQVSGGRVSGRFLLFEGCEWGMTFIIARTPLSGEIIAVHDEMGPLAMVHTNTFVGMFQHDCLRGSVITA